MSRKLVVLVVLLIAVAGAILRVVERELLTPRGRRTLSPNDYRYIGRYEGDPRSRDGSNHQGTVWPWLMGTFHHRLGENV